MKVCRSLGATGTTKQVAELVELLRGVTESASWRPAPEMAERIGPSSRERKPLVFEFRRDTKPRALVWLFADDRSARVTNIVPATPGRIEPSEYNAIAQQFAEEILKGPCEHTGCSIDFGPEERTVASELSKDALAALEAFSGGANKSTGSAHPDDGERWRNFVIQCHRDRSKVNYEVFLEWMQAEGWSDEMIIQLYDEYESGLELLRQYDPA